MDGVIANFVKRYIELFKIEPSSTRDYKEFSTFFDKFVADGHFETLELMPDAMDLIDALRNVLPPTQILSSTASEKRHAAISKQKEKWLQTHDIDFHRNFVPGKSLKKKYARTDALIIDDTESVINDWRAAGGVAIFHKNVPDTLAQLKFILDEA
jgi:cyclopropane fatty-acyl-phospholipid synthase-like methyltransferase